MKPQIQIADDAPALARQAADLIAARAQEAVSARGRFTIGLSGGSTPRAVYDLLAQEPYRSAIPWDCTYVFWSDDRAVPLDDDRSNYKLADTHLLRHVPIPRDNIKPMLRSGDDLDSAARHYVRVVRSFVPGSPPRFDLLLLGMGPDGHTASLFPHSPQLRADDELVVATPEAPLEPHVRRITFTKTLLNAAREVVFLVAGGDKAARVRQVIDGPRATDDLPSQLINPADGSLIWVLDRAAAGELAQHG